jgi:AcrR family transcriptional regulator
MTAARLTSDQRREHVLDAAVEEFAAAGYHATSTTSIARRAGISQPYIYALFPSKRELFLAAYRRVTDEVRHAFLKAADGASDPADALVRMATAYEALLGRRGLLLTQLQAYAAAGDPELRDEVRDQYIRLFEDVERASGAGREDFARFWAVGMYLTIGAAIDLPREYFPTGEPAA